ncbi:3-hydroxyacyl-CoA dehydrogenase [Rhodococcus sp. KBW08]|uniref:3-hydroxyacyl-CoA dehydrogenase NAD-binding domain-containing protein n=1 Tax=Rhodococcus sp. KBW08 TaxID=2144188 RepID=UPI000F59A8AE|nr:3-hydroxyacyl-CoA dehydrogenase NAD-binding domain-containing protein [Rhodococcus sp. KBW08]RQO46034.1 3-hydroxyacyl-CoA dehydrogenase [Rhodococcus sp. KBW08]
MTDSLTSSLSPVTMDRRGTVVVLTIDQPPVNGLGADLRAGLATMLDEIAADPTLTAVVLTGAGDGFSAGADVTQFNTPAATREPTLRSLVERLQAFHIPVVAAIHGYAFGGALELALGCHFRVASPDARLGLTETSLGLVPGAGGTQYLPRLIGVEAALDMIQFGWRVSAEDAYESGLLQAVYPENLLDEATRFAESVAARGQDPGFIARTDSIPTDFDFQVRRTMVRRRDRTATAQLAAIDCVEFATTEELPTGCDRERSVFDELVNSRESKAVRHLSFAERAAASLRGLPGTRLPTGAVGVIGAGTMGVGIAMAFADHGHAVLMHDASEDGLRRGISRIADTYAASVARGKLSQDELELRTARIRPVTSLDGLSGVDLVVEAVFEDMTVKTEVFAKLDAVCKPDAILATNTSRLDVTALARTTANPSRVIGLHFFSPANVMELLEVIPAADTSDVVLATCVAMATAIGKKPVTVGVCEGFVGNRMLTPYWSETWFLVEEGASPEQVDRAMKNFGMAMGPFAVADLAGLDINWAARKRLAPTRSPLVRYSQLADRVCERGRFGQKTGAGWFRYENGSRIPRADPVVDDIVDQVAHEAGIERAPIEDSEIVSRCILALVNEGAKILGDGIVARSGDIDVVYVNGYGFPAAYGGPMFWAEQEGLRSVLEQIRALHEQFGEHWRPAQLLVECVEQGHETFDIREMS